MKLHELVDEILGTNKNRLYKCEKCTSQVSNNCSKLLALGTCVHKNIDERNSKSPNFQTEVPCEGSNIVDGFKEDKSFFDNCSGVSSRCHIERAAAPCKKYENGYGHGTFCGDIRCNLCMCQSSDLHDRFFDGKEEPARDMLLENTMHNSSSQRQISNLQVPLGNVKVDITKNLQCKSLPVLQSDVSSEEFHLKMHCLADTTTNHERLYCNHEKVMQVRTSCYHNQADPMELPRVSGSDGLMPWHHDMQSSQNTPYLLKCQSPKSRVYQRMDIPLKRGESLPQRNCHNYLHLQSEVGPNNVSNYNGITRHIKVYSDYEFSPLVSKQWASKGTPSDVTELPKMPRGQVGDVLIALRHAKKQIQSSIKVTKNSRTSWS